MLREFIIEINLCVYPFFADDQKSKFIPGMVGPFLEMTLIPHSGKLIRRVGRGTKNREWVEWVVLSLILFGKASTRFFLAALFQGIFTAFCRPIPASGFILEVGF